MKKVHHKFNKFKEILFDPTVRILPGQIAFFLILSIFPLLILIGYAASFFDISIASLIEVINDALPKEIANTIIDVVDGKSFDSTVGISMITGLLLASNGSHAIILASNALYKFPAEDFIRRRVKALFLIIILISLFIFITFFLAFGNLLLKTIISFIGNHSLLNNIYLIFIIIKWPLAIIVMFFTIKLIYVIAPDWKILSKNTTKGALFTTVGWSIATAIFSYYISHFANYDIFYGSLSNIVILMIWVYVLSYILVIGIAINVKEYRDNEVETDIKEE